MLVAMRRRRSPQRGLRRTYQDTWDFVRLRFQFEFDRSTPMGPRPAIDWTQLLFSF